MAPVIHLVRHAQGHHNVKLENQWLRDPDLTDLGRKQCEELRGNFPYHDKITHLVASPIRRTLFTCLLSFSPAVEKGMKITALPDAQEVSLYPCDVGSDVDELKREFDGRVDFKLVGRDWNVKTEESRFYPDPTRLEARARDARLWLRDLVGGLGEDEHVVLVTHGGILHFLTEDWVGIAPGAGTGWANTEYRSYEFADQTGQDPNAGLKELPESRRRRQGQETQLSEAEQREMKAAYQNVFHEDLLNCLKKLEARKNADA